MTLCLVGRSCSGKDTIIKELEKLGIPRIITYTTRPPRDNEEDGVDYHFISNDEFETLNNLGYFAETTYYDITDNTRWHYGTAKDDIISNKCIIVNPDGLEFFKKLNDNFIVYLYANNEILWNRLRQRGSGADDARRRIEADDADFKNILDSVDFAVCNDGTKSPEEIAKLIKRWWDYFQNKKSQAALEELKKSFENLVFDVERQKWLK